MEEPDSSKIPVCENLWKCIIFGINNGLRAGGGIGEELFVDYEQVGSDLRMHTNQNSDPGALAHRIIFPYSYCRTM